MDQASGTESQRSDGQRAFFQRPRGQKSKSMKTIGKVTIMDLDIRPRANKTVMSR